MAFIDSSSQLDWRVEGFAISNYPSRCHYVLHTGPFKTRSKSCISLIDDCENVILCIYPSDDFRDMKSTWRVIYSFIAFFVIISRFSSSVTDQRHKKTVHHEGHDAAICGQAAKNGKVHRQNGQASVFYVVPTGAGKHSLSGCSFFTTWDYSFPLEMLSMWLLHTELDAH